MRNLFSLLALIGLLAAAATAAVTCQADAAYRSIDGTCNNLQNPTYGAGHKSIFPFNTDGILVRGEFADYSNVTARLSPRDGIVTPIVVGVNRVAHPSDTTPRIPSSVNTLFVFLNQFITHDIVDTEVAPFDPFGPNDAATPFDESGRIFSVGLKTAMKIDEDGVPQAFNLATSFLDLSPVYGVSNNISNALRSGVDGLLLTLNKTNLSYRFTNFPNFDLCNCVNTTSGAPYYKLEADGSNQNEIFSLTGRGFAPEPFLPIGLCVSPATSFGPGRIPGVYSCSFNQPPRLLSDIVCTINQTRLNSPAWSAAQWTVPDPSQWQPTVSQTNPQVPFNFINSQTTDPSKVFAAGDTRNTENFGILMLAQLMLRIHNARAKLLKQRGHTGSDEVLFQEARKYTIAVYQQFVYKEILPLLLGAKTMRKFRLNRESEYDSSIDPRIVSSFSTSAYRFHSMVPKVLFPVDPNNNFSPIVANRTQVYSHIFGINNPGSKPLPYLFLPAGGQLTQFGPADDFLAYMAAQLPNGLQPDEAIMAGLVEQNAQKLDRFVDKALADVNVGSCFTPNLHVSVPALTVFRGRDLGIPSYHTLRELYARESIYGRRGCPVPSDSVTADPIDCFLRLTNGDEALASQLSSTFHRLDRIDPWYGMMVEQDTELADEDDAILSKTARLMVAEQFQRLRDGDRFFYDNQNVHKWTPQEKAEIEAATLKALLEAHFPGLSGRLPDDVLHGRQAFLNLM